MENVCIIRESNLKEVASWWERHLPVWVLVYCLEGEAELSLLLKPYRFTPGMATVISADMFPVINSTSDDFKAFYFMLDRNLADKVLYDIPSGFFDAMYAQPILDIGEAAGNWVALWKSVYENKENTYRQTILTGLLHNFFLFYLDEWERKYGNLFHKNERNPAESICIKFYNLIFDHFREHRDTAFYADKLNISSCYLAMVTRQVCMESPKQAITRQVVLEIEHLLRNTNKTNVQIATELHFPDTSYMCRFFRKQTGQSLSEYRKKHVAQ